MSKLKHLFQPITLGRIELKNRLVMLAMATGYVNDGRPNKRLKQFLAERAAGGAGLIITSINVSFPHTYHLSPSISEDVFIPDLRELVETVHAHGVPVVAELVRLRNFAKTKDALPEEVGPSPVAARPAVPAPRTLDVDEIQQMVDEYGAGARRAREAGFDGVEVLAGAGNIISRFMSPLTNKREDKYGGSLENRLRFLLESIANIKKNAGDDYTVGVRYSAHEFLDGGYDLGSGKEIALILENARVDWLDLQVGWYDSIIPLITKEVTEGHWAYLAEGIKKIVHVPVITTYRISEPLVAERTLAKGKADLIGMARAFVADPEFANKAKEGRLDDIRYCICCCRCIDQVVGREVPLDLCSVNPRMGRELESAIEPAPKPKKIFIVGGGPSGTETARVAALRGHKAILCERRARLGGLMIPGSILNPQVEKMVRYQAKQMQRLGVEVRLRTEITRALIEKEKPDVVVLAVGGIPPPSELLGAEGENIFSLHDASRYMLGQRVNKKGGRIGPLIIKYFYRPSLIRSLLRFNFPFGRRVVIVGGKFAGLEFADILAEKGKVVRVLEESARMGSDIGPSTRFVTLGRMREFGVRLETSARVLEITKDGVKGVKVNKDVVTESFEIEADTIIITADLKENKELADQLKGTVPTVYLIGDATERQPISPANMWGPLQPRRIGEAIKAGYHVAIEL